MTVLHYSSEVTELNRAGYLQTKLTELTKNALSSLQILDVSHIKLKVCHLERMDFMVLIYHGLK